MCVSRAPERAGQGRRERGVLEKYASDRGRRLARIRRREARAGGSPTKFSRRAQSNSGRRRRFQAASLLAGFAGAVLGAGCGGSSPSGPAAARAPAGFFGVNGQLLRPLAGGPSQAILDRQLAAIERGGLAFVRAPFDWRQVEPRPPTRRRTTYAFRRTDAWVTALARHHLSWYLQGVGVPTPRWAANPRSAAVCGYRAAPRTIGAFAALMARMAKRYGVRGSFWRSHGALPYEPARWFEIWNEPNFGAFWCPHPQPDRFARLALASAVAIRAADPAAVAVLGGLAGFVGNGRHAGGYGHIGLGSFLRRVFAAEPRLRDEIDVVGVHAYQPTARAVVSALAIDRRALRSAGIGRKPMSLNEVGWPTTGKGAVPQRRRAIYFRQLTQAITDPGCGLDSFAPFAWTTPQSNPVDRNDWFGIASPTTGRPDPSGRAYLAVVNALQGAGSRRRGVDPRPACSGL